MDGFAVAIYAICVPNFRVVYLQFYRASSFRSTFNYSFIYISWPEKEIEMEEKENKIKYIKKHLLTDYYPMQANAYVNDFNCIAIYGSSTWVWIESVVDVRERSKCLLDESFAVVLMEVSFVFEFCMWQFDWLCVPLSSSCRFIYISRLILAH